MSVLVIKSNVCVGDVRAGDQVSPSPDEAPAARVLRVHVVYSHIINII